MTRIHIPVEMTADLLGLGADLDLQSFRKPRAPLPATAEECLQFIDTLPLPPTFVIHSGHGLQATWSRR